jgi:hypothetical protein
MLVDELKKAQERERIAAWDKAEAAVRSELTIKLPERSLSVDVRDRFGLFEKWCGEKGVRRLPAKPWVVAAFVLDQIANGRDVQSCLALLAAIERVHDSHNLSNPTATAVVRAALDQIIKIEPPRSWSKDEKAEWALLPPVIRETIARRENERDVALKRKFNELSDLKKRLLSGADEPAQTSNEGNYEHVTTP